MDEPNRTGGGETYLHGGIAPRIENLSRLDAFDRGIETRAYAANDGVPARGGGGGSEGGRLSLSFVCLFFVWMVGGFGGRDYILTTDETSLGDEGGEIMSARRRDDDGFDCFGIHRFPRKNDVALLRQSMVERFRTTTTTDDEDDDDETTMTIGRRNWEVDPPHTQPTDQHNENSIHIR